MDIAIRRGETSEARVLTELIWSCNSGILREITGNDPGVIEMLIKASADQPTLLFAWESIVVADNDGLPAGLAFGYDFDMFRLCKKPTFRMLRRTIGWKRFFLRVLPNLLRISWKIRIKRGEYYLSGVSVFPEYRKLGVGSHLLQYVETYCGAKRMVVDVAEEDIITRKFYWRHGYYMDRDWRFCGKTYYRLVKDI